MSIKVYLDSMVIVRLVLERDRNVRKIAEASREGKLEAYVSWLSLTEISQLVSRMANHQDALEQINSELKGSNIQIITEFHPSLSSGTLSPKIGEFDYADYLHLSIASRVRVNYFVTYDRDLLTKACFESFKILDPDGFVRLVLEVQK